jgi:hypothetical protein
MHRAAIHSADVRESANEAALPKRKVEWKAVKEHKDWSELRDEAEDTRLLPLQANHVALSDLASTVIHYLVT